MTSRGVRGGLVAAMHAVIFEVFPNPDRRRDYFDLAAALRPEVERVDGFLAVERFESAQEPGKVLSVSLWRDGAAVARWRAHGRHRAAQDEGRAAIFRDYRIRVAEVVREIDGGGAGSPDRPPPARAADGGANGDARPCAAILEIEPSAAARGAAPGWDLDEEHRRGLVAWEGFESLHAKGKRLVLTAWADARAARAWAERVAALGGSGYRLRLMAVERDYGMFDRAAAPPRPRREEPAVERAPDG